MAVSHRADAAHAGSGMAARMAGAARIVAAVSAQGRSLDDAMQEELVHASAGERAILRALAFGTLRWWPRLDRMLVVLLDRSPERVAPALRALLNIGLHQLEESTHPAHAVVNEAVEAARVLRAPRAAALVNAVLRRYQRDRARLESRSAKDPVLRFAHPAWLIAAIRTDWPAQWEAVLDANNRPAPMWLRVNRRRISAEEYFARLAGAGIRATRSDVAGEAIALEQPRGVHEVPGFDAGEVSVQDAAAQLAAAFLDVRHGMRVLDACAAPGGKACHLLELAPGLAELVALDLSSSRLRRVRENLDRLSLHATLLEGDARKPEQWWDGRPFDRILVDAPCSGTGVIRRHPDIKLLRRPADITRMAATQQQLLRACWSLLAPGGRLVYATCSVLTAENEAVVTDFLAGEPAAIATRPAGIDTSLGHGIRIAPGTAGMDGFYYACLDRRGAD